MPDCPAPPRSAPPRSAPEGFPRAWFFVSFSAMFGVFYFTVQYLGAARVRFLTELRATPFDIGLIAALYALAFGCQVICAVWLGRMGRRKPWFLALAALHRVWFLIVPLTPFFIEGERARIWLIVGALFAHDCILQIATPIYFSWVADLVPPASFNRHWGSRQRYITLSTLLSNLALAFGFFYFEHSGRVIGGFLFFSVLAALSGMTDLIIFSRVPEPPHTRHPAAPLGATLAQPLRDPAFSRFLQFNVFSFFVTMLAQPFFFYYMIKVLGLSVLTVQLIMVTEAVGGTVSAKFWGLVCDAYGQENGLQLSILLKVAVPLTLILLPAAPAVAVPALVLAFFLDGIVNAGFVIGWQGVMLKASPRQNRGMYIAATNFFCQGLAGGAAPLLAGSLIEPLGRLAAFRTGWIHWNGYLVVFAAAIVLRLATWPVGWRLQAAAPVPFGIMWANLRRANPLLAARLLYQLHGASRVRRRVYAATRLGRLRSPLALGGLVDALRDPEPGVREAAAEALGRIGGADAREALKRALAEPELGVQPLAARALGHIGGRESLQTLLAALGRLDPEALDQTVAALVEIDNEAAMLPLLCIMEKIQNPVLRRHISEALARLGRDESLLESGGHLARDWVPEGQPKVSPTFQGGGH